MSWQVGLILLALASVAACAIVCYSGYRNSKRSGGLPAPQRQAFRAVYEWQSHIVGHMSGRK